MKKGHECEKCKECGHPNFYDDGMGMIICRQCREVIERYAPQ